MVGFVLLVVLLRDKNVWYRSFCCFVRSFVRSIVGIGVAAQEKCGMIKNRRESPWSKRQQTAKEQDRTEQNRRRKEGGWWW